MKCWGNFSPFVTVPVGMEKQKYENTFKITLFQIKVELRNIRKLYNCIYVRNLKIYMAFPSEVGMKVLETKEHIEFLVYKYEYYFFV